MVTEMKATQLFTLTAIIPIKTRKGPGFYEVVLGLSLAIKPLSAIIPIKTTKIRLL